MRAFRNSSVLVFLVLIVSISMLRGLSAQSQVQLKSGDQAPPFSLMGSDGKTYTLAEFRGKQEVVLVWFVKAFSGG